MAKLIIIALVLLSLLRPVAAAQVECSALTPDGYQVVSVGASVGWGIAGHVVYTITDCK